MFGKKNDDGGAEKSADNGTDDLSAPPLKPFSRKGSHAPAKPPAATFHPDVQRRAPEISSPTGPARRGERARGGDSDHRRLIVGRDICLSGEITACDKLIVEGQVEVTISNARLLEISPSGFFKGEAEVEEADISGRYEGELVARDRLIIRAGGRVRGTVRYGRIVIESGGEISGDMQTLESGDAASSAPENEAGSGDSNPSSND